MDIFEIVLLAVALGIDCMVVSFAQGVIYKDNRFRNSVLLALTMGLFQGIMPCIGYFGATPIYEYIEAYSYLIVFAIFTLLGIKFILDAFYKKPVKLCHISTNCLISIGVATSMDALIAGASIKFSQAELLSPAIIIGVISFIMAFIGFWAGNTCVKLPSKYLEIIGGIILIILGIKALI